MKASKLHPLTRAEMLVMKILWEHPEGCSIHDVVACYDDPKPAYTTIATFLKILRCKQFVTARKGVGKQQIFTPLVTREAYTRLMMSSVKDNFFDGSATSLLNFFIREERMSVTELKALIQMVEAAHTPAAASTPHTSTT